MLKGKLGEQNKIVAEAEKALEIMRKETGENSAQTMKFEKELNLAKTAVANTENELRKIDGALTDAAKGFEDTEKAIEETDKELEKSKVNWENIGNAVATGATMPGNNPEHRTFSKPVGTKVLALSFDTNSNNNVPGAIVDLFTGEAAEIAMPSNPMYAISDPVGAKAFVGSMGDNHCAIVDFDEMSSTELNMPTITLGGYGWYPISLPVRGKVFVTSSGYGGAVVDITTGDFTVVRFPSGAPWGPSADISVPV